MLQPIFAFFLTFYSVKEVTALPGFQSLIPNGGKVLFEGESWPAVGHSVLTEPNKTNLNPFGLAIQDHIKGNKTDRTFLWADVCNLDSDGDGLTNGKELGDPDCIWKGPEDNGKLTLPDGWDGPRHPGFNDPIDTGDPDNSEPISITASREFRSHAILMGLAWGFFAPVGVLFAIIFKVKTKSAPSWIDWFKWHKVFVGTAIYFCLLAYVIMVNKIGQFTLTSTHNRLGTTVVILCIIQALGGFYRLHINEDGSKSVLRLAWEYFHQWTGRVCLVLAVTTIYFGLETAAFVDEDMKGGLQGLFIALLCLGGIFSFVYVLIRVDERHQTEEETKPQKSKTEEAGKTQDPETGKQAEPEAEKAEKPQTGTNIQKS